MKKRLLLQFIFLTLSLSAFTTGTNTTTQTFELIFEKSPAVVIDFVEYGNRSQTIDYVNFPLVEDRFESVSVDLTVRYQLDVQATLALICTTVQDIGSASATYIPVITGGADGYNASMLKTNDAAPLYLNYDVWDISTDPGRTLMGNNGLIIDSSAHIDSGEVTTKERSAVLFSLDYNKGSELIYNGQYTQDEFIDLRFTMNPPATGFMDGVYTGYAHLVLVVTE